MNKRTVALTTEQYKEIIQTTKNGFTGWRPNERVALALMLEGNLGIRVSDVVKLRLSDIVQDGERYRLSITEQKTGKARTFTLSLIHICNIRRGKQMHAKVGTLKIPCYRLYGYEKDAFDAFGRI